MLDIGAWLKGSKRYYLQQYVQSDKQIKKGLHAHSPETLETFRMAVKPYFESVSIRGIT